MALPFHLLEHALARVHLTAPGINPRKQIFFAGTSVGWRGCSSEAARNVDTDEIEVQTPLSITTGYRVSRPIVLAPDPARWAGSGGWHLAAGASGCGGAHRHR